MAQTRREFLRCAAGLGGLFLSPPSRSPRATVWRVAEEFFRAQQSPDGAWRSASYAAFRDGDALSPVVLWAWQAEPRVVAGAMFGRGLRWLERLTDAQSARREPWAGLRYPLFTASYAATVLARAGQPLRALFWADLLERLRTNPELGWPAEEPGCGAWSDAPEPPRFGQPLPDMLAPNISATVLAMRALRETGRVASARLALNFVERCQNFAPHAAGVFDDGGFIFALDDPIRNKAGIAGRDASKKLRYRSYGSATCDGILALRAAGLEWDHPRSRAALAWLERSRAGLDGLDRWSPDRESGRQSLVFYHAQALAEVLRNLAAPWAMRQRQALVENLRERQTADGSWRGEAPQSCEDEPLLASAFTISALMH